PRRFAVSLGGRWSLANMAAASFLFTIALMLVSRQVGGSETGDSAIWDYVAQSIIRGQIPYKDVVEIKLPGAAYLGATAIWIGKLFGVRDLIAIRLLNLAMVGSLSAITFLVAEVYLASRPVAIISFLIPLTSQRFVEWMAQGSQPRLPMILFGMLTLLLISKDRPLLAGLSSALSCMCWQPGLLFTGVAFLIFSRYLTTWRDFRALKVLAGACLPLAAMFLYFAWRGAAGELWSWSFAYTFSVYAPAGFRGILGNAKHVWNVTSRVLGPGVAFLALALLGYAILWWEILSHPRQASGAPTGRLEASGSRKPPKEALLIAPFVYVVFCLIDFKSASYLIPLIPFVGIFSGLVVLKLLRYLASVRFARFFVSAPRADWSAVGVVLVLALGSAVRSGLVPDRGLDIQTRQFKLLSDRLGPDDQIYVHGATEILAVLDRPNLNPYIF